MLLSESTFAYIIPYRFSKSNMYTNDPTLFQSRFAAGIAEDDDDSDAGDDFDDDSDDGVHEIDLESEEDRPKKKTKKNKA